MRIQTSNAAGELFSQRRRGILLAVPDGITRDFSLPEPAVHTPPTTIVEPYINGRRLLTNEYKITESIIGGGFDTVHILFVTPKTTSRLSVDYFAV